MKIFLLLLLIVLITGTSCNNDDVKVLIEGEILNINSGTVVLELIAPSRVDTVKTVKINNGRFVIRLNDLKNSFYRLRIDNNNAIYLYLRNGDNIKINTSYPEIQRNYNISGSVDSELLKELNSKLIIGSDSIIEMRERLIEANYIKGFNADSLRNLFSHNARQIFIAEKNFLIDFIKDNYRSPVIYMALYQYIDTSPIMSIDSDFDIFEFVLKNLETYNPEFEQTSLLKSDISKQLLKNQQVGNKCSSLKPGMQAPDFNLKDPDNKIVSLSEFRNKNIILIFWASWSNESVKFINSFIGFEKDTQVGPEIILFSLDSSNSEWKKAINSLNINQLINVSDFKMWESVVVKVYGINSLPTAIVINNEGIIESITHDVGVLQEFIDKY